MHISDIRVYCYTHCTQFVYFDHNNILPLVCSEFQASQLCGGFVRENFAHYKTMMSMYALKTKLDRSAYMLSVAVEARRLCAIAQVLPSNLKYLR